MILKTASALILLLTSPVWACSDNLKKFFPECQIQDRYQQLKSEFRNNFNVDIEMLTQYRAYRFIDEYDWEQNKTLANYQAWRIYGPAPKTWIYWERGAHHISDDWINKMMTNGVTKNDIETLHDNLICYTLLGVAARTKKGAIPGEIRYKPSQESPSWKAECDERWALTPEEVQLISDYDIKNEEGLPLLSFKKGKPKKCSGNPERYTARMIYLPSPKVGREVERWMNYLNNHWENIFSGKDTGLSPIDLAADVQRWFVSIHPFGDGNGRVSRFFQDAIMKSFGLPFPPSAELMADQTVPRLNYRKKMKDHTLAFLNYFEHCLNEYRDNQNTGKPISASCLPMYSSYDDSNLSNTVTESRNQFASELMIFLTTPKSGIDAFFRDHKHLDGVKNDNN